MPKFVANIDLNKNQLENTVVHLLASAPGSPAEGQIYYDTTMHEFGYYDGSAWVYSSDATGLPLSGGTMTGPIAMGSNNITGLANGVSSQDAAAFGQIPTSAGTIGGLLLTGGTMSGAIAMGSHKITGLTNGSGAQDAAAFGQTPAGGTNVTIAQGGTGQTTQQAALDALAGAVTSGSVLRGNGTHVTMGTIQAADVPGFGGVTVTGTPSAGNVVTATSSSAAQWTAPGGVTAATATYILYVNRAGPFPVYTAENTDGTVAATAADTSSTSGLKALLTAIIPNNTDDIAIRLTTGRFHFLDAPLGTESWAGVEDHYSFVGNNGITLEGAGPQSIISNYTNFTGGSPDPQPVMLFSCSRWRIRNLTVESCGVSRAPSNTINCDSTNGSVIEKVRVRSAIGHAIAIDGGYVGQWAGNNVIRDCLIQGRPAPPFMNAASGGSLSVQAYQYSLAWRCNGLGVFTATGTSSGTTATITTGSAHTYITGDSVSISGMNVSGYNGTFVITVTGGSTFTYTTSGSNIGSGTGGTAIGADVTKPGDPTSVVTTSGQQKVTITLQRGPYSCVGRVIYRYDGVNWLQVGIVNDNTTATFTDTGFTGSAVTFAHKSTIQGAGIEVMAATGCVLDGNVIDGTGDMVNGAGSTQNGVHVVQKAVGSGNVPADHNNIINNIVRQTGSHGIRVVGGNNNIIAGNQVSNPGTPSVKAQAIRLEGIASVTTNANMVTGNNTFDDQSAASWSGGASTSNSVAITSTNSPAGNVLGPNVMTGYTSSSPVSDSGTLSLLEAGERTIVLMAPGTLSVQAKISNFNFACPWPGIIKRARLYADTAPTGQAIICDYLLNGTTIWSTSGNRVQIAASANSGTQTTFNTTSFAAGDVFTFNIAQVGSGTIGSNLVMELTVLASRVYP